MANERITENLVKDKLRELGYYNNDDLTIEDQSSEINEINKLLKNASKTGKGGKGFPEFLITSNKYKDFIIIFECKASVKDHESENYDNPVRYAVDGVLHYAKFLSKSYNVIAIAASGQTKEQLKISNFVIPKNNDTIKSLLNTKQNIISEILTFEDYVFNASYDPQIAKIREISMKDFSRELHKFLWKYAKVTEEQKPLLVSGTLIALMDDMFRAGYDKAGVKDLPKAWYDAIKRVLEKSNIDSSKITVMCQPYSSFTVHPALNKEHKNYKKGILNEIVKEINEKVFPYVSVFNDIDVAGQFYGEFLKYTGGDKKALGIVLTPRHITDLFSRLANVNKDSKVLDICTGTGGFLISAMHHMCKDANTPNEIDNIKKNGLIGIEHLPHMFALAASNMILRGDGKANLHQASCFDKTITKDITSLKCNVGMINPPYSQGDDLSELNFVKHMLNCLDKGGIGIAIVPMSCAIGKDSSKEELMKYHTLEAVMSMPDELFYPVGTVTCIMIFKAHMPHRVSNKKTWFGYWKDDRFVKNKVQGRCDLNHEWEITRDKWVEAYRNNDEIPGFSVKQYVDFNDEWCAEAYMDTDYSQITKEMFEKTVKEYTLYKIMNHEND